MKYLKRFNESISEFQRICYESLVYLNDNNNITYNINKLGLGNYELILRGNFYIENIKDDLYQLVNMLRKYNYYPKNIPIIKYAYKSSKEIKISMGEILKVVKKHYMIPNIKVSYIKMNFIKKNINEGIYFKETPDVRQSIKNLKKVPKELKEVALNLVSSLTKAKNGKITGLQLHPDLIRRLNDKNLPNGFSMGIDKDGYYIHTHRARSKSKENVNKITEREIKFIDSTG